MAMTPKDDAIVALVELGRYDGPMDAFLRESATRVKARLNCSGDDATRLIESLRQDGEIDFRIDPLGSSPPPDKNSGFAWFIPRA